MADNCFNYRDESTGRVYEVWYSYYPDSDTIGLHADSCNKRLRVSPDLRQRMTVAAREDFADHNRKRWEQYRHSIFAAAMARTCAGRDDSNHDRDAEFCNHAPAGKSVGRKPADVPAD